MVYGYSLENCRVRKGTVGSNPTPSAIRRGSRQARSLLMAGRGECPELVEGLMRFVVYMIECNDGTLYVGHTRDLAQRLNSHQCGAGSLHLSQRGFKELLYQETLPDETSAVRREMQIKRWSRAKKYALAEGNFEKLKTLSRSRD